MDAIYALVVDVTHCERWGMLVHCSQVAAQYALACVFVCSRVVSVASYPKGRCRPPPAIPCRSVRHDHGSIEAQARGDGGFHGHHGLPGEGDQCMEGGTRSGHHDPTTEGAACLSSSMFRLARAVRYNRCRSMVMVTRDSHTRRTASTPGTEIQTEWLQRSGWSLLS